MKLFPLGQIGATPASLAAIAEAGQHVSEFITRHVTGDDGDLDAHDKAENISALKLGQRIFSAYTLKSGETIWIITEADRSSTTILLPDEY